MRGVRERRFRRLSYSPVGLDVGGAAVRAAQLRRTGDTWSACLLGSWRLPEGSAGLSEDGNAVQRAGRWLSQLGFRRRVAVAGLSAPDIELHAMELPNMPSSTTPRQRRQAARWETERLMSFEQGTAEIDHWSLPESKVMSSTAIGVATSRTGLDRVLEMCETAKLECAQVDASSCALARFGTLSRGPDAEKEDVWGVLDLGARMTRLIVCVGETPVLARAFDYGGQSWTEKLASSLSVSEGTAEMHKCDCGIARVARDAGQSSETSKAAGVLSGMIYNVLRTDLDLILDELERSYRYVLQCFPQRKPGPLILTGGGANMRNLDALFSERLGIEVVVPSLEDRRVAQRLDFDLVNTQNCEPMCNFACAIGLAVAMD